MRKHLLTFSLMLLAAVPSIQAQKSNDQQSENDKKYFDDTDKDFSTTDVSEKWKNESAVVLCQKFSFSYNKRTTGITNVEYIVEETVRKRIKLLDKSAVEEFSKFYFVASAKVGIRIIKPSGKVENVNISDAISNTTSVPGIFRSYAISDQYKKLAIPGLEVGDIMDYYYSTEERNFGNESVEKSFKAFLFTLNANYAVVKQTLFFNVDKGFFINFNSYNGAAKLVEGDAGVNHKGKVKEDIKTYTLTDTDREKSTEERWVYEYRYFPTVKFQVVAGTKNSWKDSEYFLGAQGEPKTAVTKKEIVLSMSRRFLNTSTLEMYFKNYTVPFIVDYLKTKFKGEKDAEKIMTEAYYAFRYKYAEVLGNPIFNASSMHDDYVANGSRIIDELFCEVMNAVAKKMKIKLEVVVAVPRSIGDFDDVLIPGELNLAVRVNNSLILSPPRFYDLHQVFDPVIEGADALVFIPEDDPDKVTFSEIKLPQPSSAQNILGYKITASIDDAMENVNVTRLTSYAGQYKGNVPAYATFPEDAELQDRRIYDVDFKEKAADKMNKSQKEAKASQDERRTEYGKKLKDYLKEEVADEYEVAEYKSFEVKSMGRTRGDEVFMIEESFAAKNMVNKAGRNYSLNLGSLIGSQVDLKEKEKTRQNDLDIDYAKTIVTEITITIPEGYTVDGLSEFNVNIDNPSMLFVSKAVQEGNILKVSVKKEYKLNHDTKNNWNNWIAALDGALNYSQKKVVLKK